METPTNYTTEDRGTHTLIRFTGCTPATRLQLITRRNLPGLSDADDELARMHIHAQLNPIDEIHCNVPVGTVLIPHNTLKDPLTLNQLCNKWSKRIDMVMKHNNQWELVELKPNADHRAIGQVLAYEMLWMEIKGNNDAPALSIACRQIDDDTRRLAHRHNIKIHTYA